MVGTAVAETVAVVALVAAGLVACLADLEGSEAAEMVAAAKVEGVKVGVVMATRAGMVE